MGDTQEPLPDNISWQEVIPLAREHKISLIALDGLVRYGYDMTRIPQSWKEELMAAERGLAHYMNVLTFMCQMFANAGLKVVLLKGYGLSLNYPIPSHRGVGDIDFILVDADGNQASTLGDELLRQSPSFVDDTSVFAIDHHTHYIFKGVVIENHHLLYHSCNGTEGEQQLIDMMQRMVVKDYAPMSGLEGLAYMPSPNMHLMFQVLHTYHHFAGGNPTLRQVCDYCMFVQRHHNEIDWQMVEQTMREADYFSFYQGLNGICTRHLGLDSRLLSPSHISLESAEWLLNDIATFSPGSHSGALNIGLYWRNKQHYRYFKHCGWLYLTICHIIHRTRLKIIEKLR